MCPCAASAAAHCTRQRRVPCNWACACKTVCRSAHGTSLTNVAAVVPRDRLNAIRDRELNRFEELRPRGMKALERARARMPNGVPMAWMSVLYTHPPVVVDSGHGGASPTSTAMPTSTSTWPTRACSRVTGSRRSLGRCRSARPPDRSSCCPRRMRLKSPAGSRTGSECRSGSSRYRRRWPTPRRCA